MLDGVYADHALPATSYCATISHFGMFGDPEEMQRQMASFMEQAQQGQKVAFADQAINLAVGITVAAIGRLELTGIPTSRQTQVRDAIRMIFPEAVTLVAKPARASPSLLEDWGSIRSPIGG